MNVVRTSERIWDVKTEQRASIRQEVTGIGKKKFFLYLPRSCLYIKKINNPYLTMLKVVTVQVDGMDYIVRNVQWIACHHLVENFVVRERALQPAINCTTHAFVIKDGKRMDYHRLVRWMSTSATT